MFNYTKCPYCLAKIQENNIDSHLEECKSQDLIMAEKNKKEECQIPCELCDQLLQDPLEYDLHIAKHYQNNSKIFNNSTIAPKNNTRLIQSMFSSKLSQPLSAQQSRLVGIRSRLNNTQPIDVTMMSEEQIYDYFTNEDMKLKRGFSQQEIVSLIRKRKSNIFQQNQICAICQNSIQKPTFLECAHGFCEECIAQWLEYKKECPVCKKEVEI